jgi:hypothetical protein
VIGESRVVEARIAAKVDDIASVVVGAADTNEEYLEVIYHEGEVFYYSLCHLEFYNEDGFEKLRVIPGVMEKSIYTFK